MKKSIEVLIVDDDKRMAKTIYDILKINGFEGTVINSGEEAIERLKESHPDCLIMDVKMNGMNGIETLKIINKMHPSFPVIIMSAYVTEEQKAEAEHEGAYAVLTKPFEMQLILDFLSKLSVNGINTDKLKSVFMDNGGSFQ
ncbi:MAG: response regulator [Spirochaetota bacterium]